MRSNVDSQKIEQLMEALGKEAHSSGCIYFAGGASALLIGWRSSTVDIDIRLDPEPSGIFQAIAKIKQELNINIELASPQDCHLFQDGVIGAYLLTNEAKFRFITMILQPRLLLNYPEI
jgi:hypothetical protein